MQIYTLNARDKKLLSLCLALVAFWIIFIIAAAISLVFLAQLASAGAEDAWLYAVMAVAETLVLSLIVGAAVYAVFYFARYKKMSYATYFENNKFTIVNNGKTYVFTREDIVSRAKCVLPRLIGKYDLTVRVRRFEVDGEVIIGSAQFTLVQLCEKSARGQIIKTFGIK